MSTASLANIQSFSYGVTIKTLAASQNIALFQEQWPGVSNFALTSRLFSSYEECISSCSRLMSDAARHYNGTDAKFKVGSEVNPIHSNQPTLSKDWADGEISRLWIYDGAMEGKGQINAVAQARIFGSSSRAISLDPN